MKRQNYNLVNTSKRLDLLQLKLNYGKFLNNYWEMLK